MTVWTILGVLYFGGVVFMVLYNWEPKGGLFKKLIDKSRLKSKNMTNDEIIEKAVRDYPVGTKFNPAHTNEGECIITKDTVIQVKGNWVIATVDNLNWVDCSNKEYGNTNFDRVLYDIGADKWAKIVSKPKELFVLPDKWYVVAPLPCPDYIAKWRSAGGYALKGYLSNVQTGTKGYHTNTPPTGHTEITMDQFKQYVLKDTTIDGDYYVSSYPDQGNYIFEARGDNSNVKAVNDKLKTFYPSGDISIRNGFKDYKKATKEEIEWLERCISAGKFVPKETPYYDYYKCIVQYNSPFEVGKIYQYKDKQDMCYDNHYVGACTQEPASILEWFSPSNEKDYLAQFKYSNDSEPIYVGGIDPYKEEKWIPSVGDWVVFMPDVAKKKGWFTDVWNQPWVLKVHQVSSYNLTFTADSMKAAGCDYINLLGSASNGIECFRKAEVWEIPVFDVEKIQQQLNKLEKNDVSLQIKIDSEVQNIRIKEIVPVRLKSTENEIKINVKQNFKIKL